MDDINLFVLKSGAKGKERLRVSPSVEEDGEEDVKRPRLTRDFKPFDYEGSKFTEFTKGRCGIQSNLPQNSALQDIFSFPQIPQLTRGSSMTLTLKVGGNQRDTLLPLAREWCRNPRTGHRRTHTVEEQGSY